MATASASPSPAPVSQTISQKQNGATVYSNSNDAHINGHAFNTASGEIGVNVAGGNGNQQANATFINTDGSGFVFTGQFTQSAAHNSVNTSGSNYGDIAGNAFGTASGDVNVNVAGGSLNQQINSSLLVPKDDLNAQYVGKTNGSNAPTSQTVSDTSCSQCSANNGYIGGHAFQDASGAVSVNVAGGNVNQQSNMLTVAKDQTMHSAVDMQGVNDYLSQTASGSGTNSYTNAGQNNAYVNGTAFQTASGAIDVNVAGGNANQQMNRSAIYLQGDEIADALVLDQSNGGSATYYGKSTGDANGNTAYLSGNAFENATGAIGVNVGAGNGNQQANSLTIMTPINPLGPTP